jgi:hypothetical protein
MKSLLLACLLALATFATAPTASADVCKDGKVDATLVDVYTFADCSVEVVVFEDLACLWGTEKHSTTVGPVTVSYYTCAPGPGEPTTPPLVSPCVDHQINLGLWGSYVALHADCTADVILFPNIICVGANVGRVDRTVGPVHVQVSFCKPPTPPPQ